MQDVLGRVADLVSERFEQTRKVVLLSYVGQVLSREGFNVAQISGDKGFAQFLRDHASDAVEIVALPDDPKNLAAVPAGTDLEKEIDPFGTQSKKRERSDARKHSKSRINKGLWFSFSHELTTGCQRYVTLQPVVRYEDFPAGQDGDGILVPSDKIIPSGTLEREARDEAIYKNILEWAGEHKINLDLLSDAPRGSSKRMSLLDHFFDVIPDDELAAIQLPASVVKKMQGRII